MQLDYKDIIIKHYALSMSGSEIARQTGFSKSGVNDFLRAFKRCEDLSYPLPAGITNYGIALKVYGSVPGSGGRNENIELPDYEDAAKLMATRKNMTLMFLWNRYKKKCEEEGVRFYQYSHEYSDAIVHAFRKFRAPFSGKAVHTFPEWSAVIYLVFRWNFYSMLFQECL